MKLFELISTQSITRNVSKPFDVEKLEKEKDIWSPGSGAYAKGEVDKKDPHTFNKVTHVPSDLEKDGYYQYVKAMKPYINDNPYFPRIYVVRLDKDPAGKIIPKYSIETLSDGSDFSIESLVSLGKRIYKEFPDLAQFYEDDFGASKIRNRLARQMSRNIATNDFSDIKDKNLKGALMLIGRLVDRKSLALDLHKDNIMFRGTPNGPQLVITDPIS